MLRNTSESFVVVMFIFKKYKTQYVLVDTVPL